MRGSAARGGSAGVGVAVPVKRVRVDAGVLPREAPAGCVAARERLGIPGGVVVMTGHQAEAWHGGIAAKFFLARALADTVGGSSVWLTPDHDVSRPWVARAPVVVGGRLAARELELADEGIAGRPACLREAAREVRVVWGDGEPALDSVREGMERHAGRLRERSDAPDAARQVTSAMGAALGERGRSDARVWASELGRIGALDELIDRMAEDAAGCASAYNAAARAHPGAGVGELRVVGDRVELPVWRLQNGMRVRVWSDEIGEVERGELAPRALVMAAAACLDLCDLFVHGTGGGAYDRVMRDWLGGWLGDALIERLAPVAVATADVVLPLEEFARDDAEIDAAAWRAHAARHDPGLVGDEKAAREKRRLVGEIEAAKERGEDPAGLFREMHGLLERVREERGGEIERLDAEAARLAGMRGSAAVARDRTWPVFLHEDRVIGELADRVGAEAAGVRSPARSRRG